MRNIKGVLSRLKNGRISLNDALERLKTLPFEDLGYAKIDNHRALRRGYPEVVFGGGKKIEEALEICSTIIKEHGALLVTHADLKLYKRLKARHKNVRFDRDARLVYLEPKKMRPKGFILIITAGTSDFKIAREAEITCRVMGSRTRVLPDVGVAGLHRLLAEIRLLQKANVLIVIAGMDGALASVVSGLVSKPVIAVPTSVGYGASFKGIGPLLTMLNTCSPGVSVVNIDNGFGAGYFASMVNK